MSVFSLTDPAFEECKDCTIGCFFFEYPELHGKHNTVKHHYNFTTLKHHKNKTN